MIKDMLKNSKTADINLEEAPHYDVEVSESSHGLQTEHLRATKSLKSEGKKQRERKILPVTDVINRIRKYLSKTESHTLSPAIRRLKENITTYSEPIIFSNPSSPVAQEATLNQIKDDISRKYQSQQDRKRSILNGEHQINLSIKPNNTMASRGIINSLTPDKEVYTALLKLGMLLLQGQPGTGKSVMLNNLIKELVKLYKYGVLKGYLAKPTDFFGLYVSDSKLELQDMVITAFDGLNIIDEKGEEQPYLTIVSPVERQLDIKGVTKVIPATDVNLVGDLPYHFCAEVQWTMLEDGKSSDNPFWSSAGFQLFNAQGMISHAILKITRTPRTFYRLFLENQDPKLLLEKFRTAEAIMLKKSSFEQTLFFYDLLETYDYRSSKFLDKVNAKNVSHEELNKHLEVTKAVKALKSKFEAEFRLKNPGMDVDSILINEQVKNALASKNVIDDKFLDTLDDKVKVIIQKYQERDVLSDADVMSMFTPKELENIYTVAEHNKIALCREFEYFTTNYPQMGEQTIGNVRATLQATLRPLTSNPGLMSWLMCENGITGADVAKGRGIAIYISRDEQPLFYDFANKVMKKQVYDAMRKRTGTYQNPESNKNKGISVIQCPVIEITDEEYLTMGDGSLEMAIIAIMRSLGLLRWVATQYKTQYDETLGGGNANSPAASNYIDIQSMNIISFDTNTATKEYFKEKFGNTLQNSVCQKDEIPTGIDKYAIYNARMGGYTGNIYNKGLYESLRYDEDSETYKKDIHPDSLLPPGAITTVNGPIFQFGDVNRSDWVTQDQFLKKKFNCFFVIRQGEYEQFGYGTMIPHYLRNEYETAQEKLYYDLEKTA